ncbi:MAG TPA: sulfatase [Thermoanaerobaculia bacterium]|nr:sulfatase [Thermoanaerobaculia bacterium]
MSRRLAGAGSLPSSLLLVPALLLLVACGGHGSGRERLPERPPDILLLTIDTLRADHLSAWGYERQTSPVLDRIAAEGVRFERAQVQWPKTAPSFASMFTATYPKDNGVVRRVGMPIDCRLRLLAEELQALGYQTHAVVANGALGREYFFDQGFDSYLEAWKAEPGGDALATGARNVTDLALARLEHLDPDKPLFLWVHYIDPHAPYRPEGEFRDRFQGDEHFVPGTPVPVDRKAHRRFIGAIGRSQVVDDGDDLAFYVARYDAEIRYADAEIGRLVETLRAKGLWDRMLTVMTSDHGESLGEHRYFFGHGMLAYQTCLHVPLIVRWPGVFEPRVDAEPVELIHLSPTILDLAGAPLENGTWAQGRSLLPRLFGERDGGDPIVHAESGYATNENWIRTVSDGRWKLLHVPWRSDQRKIAGEGVRWVLYDLEQDPGETENLAERRPEERERLAALLQEWADAPRFPVQRDAEECADDRAVDERTEQELRALGYL